MKHILSLSIALCACGATWGNPDWKIHNTFDEEVSRIVDTSKHTYFISRTQPYSSTESLNNLNLYSLFRYDKEADELSALSTDNILSDNVVSCIEYSPEKRMLVVVYANHNVDLIYDNGDVANIPTYMHATVSHPKVVNSIFIDAPANRIYLATGFGYVALDDRKLEVADSRIYDTAVKGVSRTGDKILLLTDDALYMAPAADPRYNLSEYTKIADVPNAAWIARIGDGVSLMCAGKTGNQQTYIVAEENGAPVIKESRKGYIYNLEHNAAGATLADSNHIFQYYPDGHYDAVVRLTDDRGMAAASADLSEVWFGKMRKGICSRRYNADAEDKWTVTRDFMLPDAPAPFRATSMKWHENHGLLVANHGLDQHFKNHGIKSPILLSSYRNGMWEQRSPVYTWPEGVASLMNPNGLAVDPDNPDRVYFGSILHGIERINMKDGSDILHLSRTSDPFRDQPGYVEIVPDQQGVPSPALGGDKSWKEQCMFSAPEFDSYGNMWTAHCDWDDQNPLQTHIYCWEAADRRASTDAASYRPMKRLSVTGLATNNYQFLKPLTAQRNRDIVLWTNSCYNNSLALIHTNGTPADQSDDRVITNTATFTDQDGADFEAHYIMTLHEDPATGYVWVGHRTGVFYFNPSDWLDGKKRVTRIKVARNDGTNLADYLLNDVPVNKIAIDGGGRKWFATSGAGVVCTSSDGRTIEEEFTAANSPLPDDFVYGIGYIPTSNSMMFSTDMGMAEYFLSSKSSGDDAPQARAYPNPVRPDYFGYVTIDNIPDGSLVKIMDSRGNLVKELGYVSGSEAKWDVTDLAFRRVGSGVYYILTSGDENSTSSATVGKILVVN